MARRDSHGTEILLRSHQMLMEDLRRLEQAARKTKGTTSEEIRGLLASVRRRLAGHFHLEEKGGYLEAERTREPRLERPAEELAEEHGQLTRNLEELIKRAADSGQLDESLLQEVGAWVASVRRHEIRENDLVQDAYNLDLGAED